MVYYRVAFLLLTRFLVKSLALEPPRVGKADLFDALANRVPPFQRYLQSDELKAFAETVVQQSAGKLQLEEIGRSAKGLPIYEIQGGEGEQHVLIYAGAGHGVGSVTLMYLARELATNPLLREVLDVRWHLVLCADPDVAELSEEWNTRPRQLVYFARGVWLQPEEWKVDRIASSGATPAQEVFASLHERYPFALTIALRDEPFSGIACTANRYTPELKKELVDVFYAENFLMRTDSDSLPSGTKRVGPALYQWEKGQGPVRQEMVAAEVMTPLFFDPKSVSNQPATSNLHIQMEKNFQKHQDLFAFANQHYEAAKPHLSEASSLWNTALSYALEEKLQEISLNPGSLSTHAEEFDLQVHYTFRSLRVLGQLLRLLEAENEAYSGIAPTALRESLEQVRERFKQVADQLESELDYTVVSIQRATRIPLLALLALVDSIQ
jgi:hypothetical protein